MKLQFLAKDIAPTVYEISADTINGIDCSFFTKGAQFIGNEQTEAAGIFDMFWRDGERHVVLAQPAKTVGLPWGARGQHWINVDDYDPSRCYLTATNAQALALLESAQAEYWQDPVDSKWTVRLMQTEVETQEPSQ